ncbi:hypothetical protein [Snodgrassella alvi]|jgi:hypothetical protein|uniref:hypothetical protein n=1 Tax=Snodgrassella alvi TaxID=1196083 RepID=UPI000C1F452C|nr:hypothetical protein [Snodgrassella alvi]PIT51304.1 hypothetical protein BHC51_00015 [Snodgrassella alvi]
MLLKLNEEKAPMKIVFLLSEELKNDPERVALTQALTLNTLKPKMGLKGSHGLFASQEWWNSIKQGKMPLKYISGVITSAYIAGQDPSKFNNTIDIVLNNGSIESVGIYVNNDDDVSLFKVGHKACIVYALDEMKAQPDFDGSVNYSQTALEMAVSLEPCK